MVNRFVWAQVVKVVVGFEVPDEVEAPIQVLTALLVVTFTGIFSWLYCIGVVKVESFVNILQYVFDLIMVDKFSLFVICET